MFTQICIWAWAPGLDRRSQAVLIRGVPRRRCAGERTGKPFRRMDTPQTAAGIKDIRLQLAKSKARPHWQWRIASEPGPDACGRGPAKARSQARNGIPRCQPGDLSNRAAAALGTQGNSTNYGTDWTGRAAGRERPGPHGMSDRPVETRGRSLNPRATQPGAARRPASSIGRRIREGTAARYLAAPQSHPRYPEVSRSRAWHNRGYAANTVCRRW